MTFSRVVQVGMLVMYALWLYRIIRYGSTPGGTLPRSVRFMAMTVILVTTFFFVFRL